MDIKELKNFIDKLSELDIKYNYNSIITQIRTNLTQLKAQRAAPQVPQPLSAQSQARPQNIANIRAKLITLANQGITALMEIQNEVNNYSFVKTSTKLKFDTPYSSSNLILLNKVVELIDNNLDPLISEFSEYAIKLSSYNQFVNSSKIVLKDFLEENNDQINSDLLILFFEGEANIENLKDLSKASSDWNQIVNCFGRLSNENNTEINIISIEKGSLIATLAISKLIIDGLLKASDKIMDFILKIYEIRIKALELKKLNMDSIAGAVEILEKQTEVDLNNESGVIVKELMAEYGWTEENPLYHETQEATIKAVKKIIKFHNSGGKVDSKLLNPKPEETEIITRVRSKNTNLLQIEDEIKKLTGNSRILEIKETDNDEDENTSE